MSEVLQATAAQLHGLAAGVTVLRAHPPFDAMSVTDLHFLLERARLRFMPAESVVIAPDDGPVQSFFIVKQGHIHGERTVRGQTEVTFEIGAGECFPFAALLGERATRTLHRASEDTFCYVLTKDDFVALLERSEIFQAFALRGVSHLLDHVTRRMRRQSAADQGEDHSLDITLGTLVGRTPVVCSPEESLQTVVARMQEAQVSSVVAIDDAWRPLGVFTLRDLRRTVASGQMQVDDAVSRWMTPQPVSLPVQATAFDALLLMTERHIAHLLVMEGERLHGVISERDLFALQRINLVQLARAIARADHLDTLAELRDHVAQLATRMLAHGASAVQVTHLITQMNDHIVRRVLNRRCQEHPECAALTFSWIVFGSEGRQEQTLHTDQDNGIVFEVPEGQSAAQVQALLLPLAEAVNRDLDALGYTWCKGNIMACNPDLCLSLPAWHQFFQRLVATPTPAHLLSASIYFDARVVWGSASGWADLLADVRQRIRQNTIFQRYLAQAALESRPPLGRFRDFVLNKGPGVEHTLDLKVQGLTPFVDGARVLALVHDVAETSTLGRLQALVAAAVIEPADGAAYAEAYQFIQLLRLQRHHELQQAQQPLSNHQDPDQLNPLDRRILRESLRQAKRLQASLELRFLS